MVGFCESGNYKTQQNMDSLGIDTFSDFIVMVARPVQQARISLSLSLFVYIYIYT